MDIKYIKHLFSWTNVQGIFSSRGLDPDNPNPGPRHGLRARVILSVRFTCNEYRISEHI